MADRRYRRGGIGGRLGLRLSGRVGGPVNTHLHRAVTPLVLQIIAKLAGKAKT